MGDLLLGHVVGEVPQGEAVGRERLVVREHGGHARLDGVSALLGEGEQVGVALSVREFEAGDPAHRVPGVLEGGAQPFFQGAEFGAGRSTVEAADPDVDRVDGPAPE